MIFDELTMLVMSTLKVECPVLSGNMSSHIEIEEIQPKFAVISVSGPSYDLKKFRKEGIIEYTGEYDYAVSVNNVGAFLGRSTKSKHWANRAVVKACRAVGQIYDAKVKVNVEL